MQRFTPLFIEIEVIEKVWANFYQPWFREGLTLPDPEHKRYLCDSTPAEIIITIEIGLI